MGGVCLFLLASALSLWDEVFLHFSLFFYCFFRLGFVFVHKTQSTKYGWFQANMPNVLLILMLMGGGDMDGFKGLILMRSNRARRKWRMWRAEVFLTGFIIPFVLLFSG